MKITEVGDTKIPIWLSGLIRNHVLRKDGHFAVPVMHLWHPENSRSQERVNYQKLKEIKTSLRIKAAQGIDKYL